MVDLRDAVAEAVHNAVIEFTGRDGPSLCSLYAVAGQQLAGRVMHAAYMLQAGSLHLLADPPDGWVALNASAAGLSNGRYHAWFARGGHGNEPTELVDLSARHYSAWADLNRVVLRPDGHPVRWTRGTTPRYVWLDSLSSDWVGLVADPNLTAELNRWAGKATRHLVPLHELARQHFLKLSANGTAVGISESPSH